MISNIFSAMSTSGPAEAEGRDSSSSLSSSSFFFESTTARMITSLICTGITIPFYIRQLHFTLKILISQLERLHHKGVFGSLQVRSRPFQRIGLYDIPDSRRLIRFIQ